MSIKDGATAECEFEFCLGDRVQLKSNGKETGIIKDGQCEIIGGLRRVIYLVDSDRGFHYLALQEEIQPEGD